MTDKPVSAELCEYCKRGHGYMCEMGFTCLDMAEAASRTAELEAEKQRLLEERLQWIFSGARIAELTQQLADSDLAFNHAEEVVGKLEAEVTRLRDALQEIMAEADQSNGGKGAKLPIVLHVRAIAAEALRAGENKGEKQ